MWRRLTSTKSPGQIPSKRFGFAVVGLGHVGLKFIDALQGSREVSVTALISADPAKATRVGRKYDIDKTLGYQEFSRLQGDESVQAVYLALPNALHCEFTALAARAGKHVLCEKPMAPSPSECQAMIEECHKAKRLLTIGYRCAYDPVYQAMIRLLSLHTIGRIRSIASQFGIHAKPGWRLDSSLDGSGSLYDLGIYSIKAIDDALGSQFDISTASGIRNSIGTEVAVDWAGETIDGASIHCRSSYIEQFDDLFTVEGDRGTITLAPAFSYRGSRLKIYAVNPATGERINRTVSSPHRAPSLFRVEAEHLARCAIAGVQSLTPGEYALRDIQRVQEIYQRAVFRTS